MTGLLYDNLIALFIVGTIFVAAVVVIPNVSYMNLLYVDEQQLRNIALDTMKAILLGIGYPADWGSKDPFDQNDVHRLGLAYPISSSFYVLDSDKVQRLVVDNPLGYVEYEKMRELLSLKDYGFNIKIITPFNVSIKNQEFKVMMNTAELEFKVKVSHNDGSPIPNAIVDVTIIYTTKRGDNSAVYITPSRVLTNPVGICEVEEQLRAPRGEVFSDVIVVVKAMVADVATMVVVYQRTPPNDIAEINMVGDNIILTVPEATPRGARWIDNIIVFNWETLIFLYNGTRSNEDKLTYGQGYKVWNKNFNNFKHSNPTLLIFNFWAVQPGQGRKAVLIAGPYPNLMGPRVLQYGSITGHSSAVVKLVRNVVISGMTYVVELTFWKESP